MVFDDDEYENEQGKRQTSIRKTVPSKEKNDDPNNSQIMKTTK